MDNGHRCTLYCEGEVHADLITVHGGVTPGMFERYAAAHGMRFHGARQVVEVDLAAEQAKREVTWNTQTGEWKPYEARDSGPDDEVWLVRLSGWPSVPQVGGSPSLLSRAWRWMRRC